VSASYLRMSTTLSILVLTVLAALGAVVFATQEPKKSSELGKITFGCALFILLWVLCVTGKINF
jgi:hypothetical protein